MNSIKHWKLTRILSLPLVLASFYFLAHIDYVTTRSHMQLVSWIKTPAAGFALVVFTVCGFWHAQLGMDEIIIDYVPARLQKLSLLAAKAFFGVLGAASLYAIFAIRFGNL